MRVLGIDPGSRVCGYGVIEPLGLLKVRYVECGVIEPDARSSMAARLAEIAEGLRGVIHELRPKCVAVEGIFHGVNPRSALKLGQSRGVALLVAAEADLPVFEYAPATVKVAVSGSGRASKQQVLSMVQRLCALKSEPRFDASDALAVALCHTFRTRIDRVRLRG